LVDSDPAKITIQSLAKFKRQNNFTCFAALNAKVRTDPCPAAKKHDANRKRQNFGDEICQWPGFHWPEPVLSWKFDRKFEFHRLFPALSSRGTLVV